MKRRSPARPGQPRTPPAAIGAEVVRRRYAAEGIDTTYLTTHTERATSTSAVLIDERGDRTPWEADFKGKTVIVVGAEGSGLHRMTAEKCDFLLRIPMQGEISSLNVSVAAGIALFEVVRQRSMEPDESDESE